MKKIFSKGVILSLAILMVFGFFLRNLYIKDLAITFGYDQARDLFIVKEIIDGDFKIQGPSANAPGMYHGVFYYYFLVIPYLISNGNPVVAEIWLSIFNTLTIALVYFLCFVLTKDKRASLLSALFFTVSYEVVQYASWLSNPSMAIWFVPLIYMFLWLWTNSGRKLFPILTGLFLGLSIQSDLFLVYHIIPIIIWLFLNRKNINLKQTTLSIFGLMIGSLTLIVSEVKFNFQIFTGLKYLFGGGDKVVNSMGFIDIFNVYIGQITNLFSLNLFPKQISISKLFGLIAVTWIIFMFFKYKNNSIKPNPYLLLILYIFSHLPVVWFGGLASPYIAVGIGVAICILAGLFISNIYLRNKYIAALLILTILYLNISSVFIENKKGQTIFSTRPQMLLSNLISVVDYTYQSSNNEKFSIDTVTAPLWLNTTWSAVYNMHGKKVYGYLPAWHGKDQVGYWGDNLEKKDDEILLHYLIIEPRAGIPPIYIKYAIDDENSKSKIVEEKTIDGITIQKRIKIR